MREEKEIQSAGITMFTRVPLADINNPMKLNKKWNPIMPSV
jgi:hypothetical protein